MTRGGARREGWGSAEATEMVLNNLFYITAKVSDSCENVIEKLQANWFLFEVYGSSEK